MWKAMFSENSSAGGFSPFSLFSRLFSLVYHPTIVGAHATPPTAPTITTKCTHAQIR
jgi:hypothetical protein